MPDLYSGGWARDTNHVTMKAILSFRVALQFLRKHFYVPRDVWRSSWIATMMHCLSIQFVMSAPLQNKIRRKGSKNSQKLQVPWANFSFSEETPAAQWLFGGQVEGKGKICIFSIRDGRGRGKKVCSEEEQLLWKDWHHRQWLIDLLGFFCLSFPTLRARLF